MESAQDRLAQFIKQGEQAAREDRHSDAAASFASALEITPNDAYLRQQLALHTYKSKQPSAQAAIEAGWSVLALLKPEQSVDPETLGISGAIYKRLYALTGDRDDLDKAISFCAGALRSAATGCRLHEHGVAIRGFGAAAPIFARRLLV